MIDYAKSARPYAKAAFEYAQEQQQLDRWSVFLHTMSQRISQSDVSKLINNPKLTADQQLELMLAIGKDVLDEHNQNFLRSLTQNHRINALPKIAELFEQFRNEAEHSIQIKVKSAIPLTEAYLLRLKDKLSHRFNRNATLQCEVDPNLIGGLIVYADGNVIDGSVRGQLQRMREEVLK